MTQQYKGIPEGLAQIVQTLRTEPMSYIFPQDFEGKPHEFLRELGKVSEVGFHEFEDALLVAHDSSDNAWLVIGGARYVAYVICFNDSWAWRMADAEDAELSFTEFERECLGETV